MVSAKPLHALEEPLPVRHLHDWNTDCSVLGIMNRKTQICTLNLQAGAALPPMSPVRQRLARAFCLLEKIQLDRVQRRDPCFGTLIEERMIWSELLDLELHEIDEQIGRSSEATGDEGKGGPC